MGWVEYGLSTGRVWVEYGSSTGRVRVEFGSSTVEYGSSRCSHLLELLHKLQLFVDAFHLGEAALHEILNSVLEA